MKYLLVIFILIFFISCHQLKSKPDIAKQKEDSVSMQDSSSSPIAHDSPLSPVENNSSSSQINTGNTSPAELVKYAETLIGIPYLYGSTDPQQGFDCSGFITYVFNHFNITVPRSSIEFTNVATEVPVEKSKPGDLILFTGTDSTERSVGHMGIIISNDSIQTLFIHSTSGKANGVTITPLNNYYKGRFMKVIRVFPQNND